MSKTMRTTLLAASLFATVAVSAAFGQLVTLLSS